MSLDRDLKSSAHVWGDSPNDTDNIADDPPAYSVPVEVSPPPSLPVRSRGRTSSRDVYHPIEAITRWAKVPWSRYVIPESAVSADRTTVTTTQASYLNNQQALTRLLIDQGELPPIPMIQIAGTHLDSVGSQKVDFNITINISSLLDITKPPRWRNKPAQVVPLPDADGRAWASSSVSGSNNVQIDALARQFLKDKSDRKSLVFSRCVDNLPTDVIEGLVRNLIASLNYRGKLSVVFPVQCGKLIIERKPASAGAAVGGWFMNVLGLAPDVKYETLERVWEIGSPALSEHSETGSSEGSSTRVSNASILIKEWWSCWAPVIRDAVLLRRQAKVGIEDWIETQMGWRPRPITRDWGVDRA